MTGTGAGTGRFRWPLSPFQHKLEWERDAARARLARALQAVRESDRQRGELATRHDAGCALAAASARQALDPGRQRYTLGYLAELEVRMRALTRLHDGLQQGLAQARDECAACERRLDGVERSRTAALAAHQRAAALRADRLTDDEWLLHAGQRFAGEGPLP